MRVLIILLYCLCSMTGLSVAQAPVLLGNIDSHKITEASGIAASATLPGCFWTHNDSGNKPEVYLLNGKGQLICTVSLDGAGNRDWEDIATGPGPVKDKQYVYVGDIGDNKGVRKHVRIYRFPEPAGKLATTMTVTPDVLTLYYPDSPRDAESLMIDPLSKQLYIVSKREQAVHLYKTNQLLFNNKDKVVLEKLIKLPYTWVTSGDISKDGHHIVIKTLTTVYYWHRNTGESVEQAMAKPATELPYVIEKQGEAITITPDNKGYVTTSEGKQAPIYLYHWKF
ncbi:hypothetical protein [Chitinophaga nivalis]|uniref:PE-PGRS family protein n=1 Tax=Chitinophaga nivalis TaxID=2991709 RepID=A0ABT3IFE1_9BACT|nr:hypothetical protein [Chitinophaga nivalis]MCW3467626.1 hypothetical protein [Chitinophaga nivalis]MCW3482682.1 hypothetical protein [Chitinophaga nivalis]